MTTIFFLWTAVAIGATVFAGFWFTYFGPMLSGDRTLGGASVALATLMVATVLLVVGVRMADAMTTGDPYWSTAVPAEFVTLVLNGPDSAMWLGLLGGNLFIVAGVVHDALRDRRVHPAWWIGLSTCVALAAVGRTFGFLY